MATTQDMEVAHLRICVCLWLARGLSAAEEHVTGSVNGTVTLPCTYLVSDGVTSMCWGRGSCPSSGCNTVIIQTDGSRVTWRRSDRYQLLGNIAQGDVSLTITGVTEGDGGTYCCRVEITGWFNDQKKQIHVRLREATQKTSSAPTSRTHGPTSGSVSVSIPSTWSPGADLATNKVIQMTDLQESQMDNNATTVIIAGVVITIILLVVLLVTIYIYRYKIRNKLKSRNNMITLEGLGGPQSPAEENIYTE